MPSPEDVNDLAIQYNRAESEFMHAFHQMNYWKEEAGRRNEAASALCQRLADAKKAEEENAQLQGPAELRDLHG